MFVPFRDAVSIDQIAVVEFEVSQYLDNGFFLDSQGASQFGWGVGEGSGGLVLAGSAKDMSPETKNHDEGNLSNRCYSNELGVVRCVRAKPQPCISHEIALFSGIRKPLSWSCGVGASVLSGEGILPIVFFGIFRVRRQSPLKLAVRS
jgi:hypothetical protein